MIECKHWVDCGVVNGGCCKIDKYPKPSYGVCLIGCESNTDKPDDLTIRAILGNAQTRSLGLGDTVKKVINKVTRGKVKTCGGCKKRQVALNKLLPYKGA